MSTPEHGEWQRTSPFAILFFLGSVLRQIINNAWQALAPLAAVLVTAGGTVIDRLKVGGVLIAIAIVVVSVLRYWFFRFRLAEDAILIREGVFKKKQLDIKFGRVQGINTQQNIIFRYFGLVTVAFETAGSSSEEGKLPAVTGDFADSLRGRIGRAQTQEVNASEMTEARSAALLTLGWRDMVKIGLSDKRALIVFAILGPLYERFNDSIERQIASFFDRGAQEVMQYGITAGVFIVVFLILFVLLLLALISIAAAFLRYHNFQLFQDGATLRSQGGLLTTHDLAMGLSKVQTVRAEQGIILRLFKRFRMNVRQARSSSRQHQGDKSFTVPIVTAGELMDLRPEIMGAEGDGLIQNPFSDRFAPISGYYMRLPMRIHAVVPMSVTGIAYAAASDPAVALFLLWIPIAYLAIYLTWRHAGYLFTNEGLVRRSGTIGYRTVALLFRKTQRVTVYQSPLQRRKKLATLKVHTAGGSARLPYIPETLALQMRDYILYKVESTRQPWH